MHSHMTPTNSPDGITECIIFNWNYPDIAFYGVAREYRNSFAIGFYLYICDAERNGWDERWRGAYGLFTYTWLHTARLNKQPLIVSIHIISFLKE